jgi:DNA polymerase-3 subunit alpha
MKLDSIAHLDGFYYKPRVDKQTLKKYSKGIVATSACLAGEISKQLIKNDYDEAKKLLVELLSRASGSRANSGAGDCKREDD